jgi:uncharacterized membrane protein
MNLHPVFVHFPIALLTIYALVELACLYKPIRARGYVFYVKAAFLIVGALATAPTYWTGYIQKESFVNDPAFYHAVDVHSDWALATIIVFGFLALAYAAAWVSREWTGMPEKWKKILAWHRYVTETPLAPALALIGLGVVTVTGALGGYLVFGADVDPMVSLVYKLLLQ